MTQVGEVYFSGPMAVMDASGNPVTDQVTENFTRALFYNGVLSAIPVVVTHLSSGNYTASFLPDQPGSWTLIVTSPTYYPVGWGMEVHIDPYAFRTSPLGVQVPGNSQVVLDSVEPGDFMQYFTRDFKYLPVYLNTRTYFKDQNVYINQGGPLFFTLLADTSVGVPPYPPTSPATWQAVNINPQGYVLDSDIGKAINQARGFLNPEIFENNQVMLDAFFYCIAHFLVIDLRMAESGIDSRGEGNIGSKSVGSVSVSYQLPEAYAKDAMFSQFAQTGYGQKFLAYILPRLVGRMGIAWGASLP